MLKEGTYSARARGMAGFVGVTLTVADNKISTVDLDLSTETPQYGQKAEKTLKQEILDKQSADIDAVTGATFTSNGVKEATSEALKQAKYNCARYYIFHHCCNYSSSIFVIQIRAQV